MMTLYRTSPNQLQPALWSKKYRHSKQKLQIRNMIQTLIIEVKNKKKSIKNRKFYLLLAAILLNLDN